MLSFVIETLKETLEYYDFSHELIVTVIKELIVSFITRIQVRR